MSTHYSQWPRKEGFCTVLAPFLRLELLQYEKEKKSNIDTAYLNLSVQPSVHQSFYLPLNCNQTHSS